MDLPINDKDLDTIVNALALGGDARLYHLLKEVKSVRDNNPDGPYKKILRCLLYTSPSPRDRTTSRMPSAA